MLNYNFRDLLSSYEFECFSRDLLNAHEDLNLANFAEGRDGGIDLRYTSNNAKTIIVQAKRYKDYQELKPVLKKEVGKVRYLKPNRYIITTSVDLTAANKGEIMDWFQPYIKNENDIIAKQDLNKLLGLHPEVERQYYKLWLASSNVLTGILNKNIVNWTLFEEHAIKETVKTYVMNNSFDEALQRLITNHYVVISGEPGIGKTTLARVLIMHLLSDKFTNQKESTNYEEFYCTNNNIEDLVRVYQPGKRQVFFYDDFLGQISLEEGEKGFDKRIIDFIKACRAAEAKLLILTTREYILQQGLSRYPLFKTGRGIEMSKCVVDMGKYTRFVRAQILYNHLVASTIPRPYIDALLQDKNYLKIIDHPHFSPRIIETFVGNGTHETCSPAEYFKKVLGFFDHPDSVWLDAFSRLGDVAQEALLVLYSMPEPVLLEDWKEAYYFFFHEVHKEVNYFKDQEWKDAVKILQNNFIRTGKCPEGIYVTFHNPGVKEVLVRYVRDNENLRELLLDNILFIDQFFGVLSDYRSRGRAVSIPSKLYQLMGKAFDKCWGNYKSCRVTIFRVSDKIEYFRRSPLSKVDALYYLSSGYSAMFSVLPSYIENRVTQTLMISESCAMSSKLSLLERIDVAKTNLDLEALFNTYCEQLYSSVDCLDFAASMEQVFPEHLDYLESEDFCNIAAACLDQELDSSKDSELEELDSTAKELCRYSPILESETVIDRIEEAYNNYCAYLDEQAEAYQDDYYYGFHGDEKEDAWRIDNLFSSIKERDY